MWLERGVTIVTLVSTLVGGFLWMDDHYASAADLKRLEQNIKRDRIEDRIRDVSNKIFELEFKQRSSPQTFSPLDAALLERYRNDLQDLQRRSRDLDK